MAPAWSKDGTSIAFWSQDRNGRPSIWIMRRDGSGLKQLASDLFTPWWGTEGRAVVPPPALSPDGARIAVQRGHDIHIVERDRGRELRVTNTPAYDFGPSWSPDGRRIAFGSQSPGGSTDIYLVDADGSNLTNLSNDPANYFNPVWSPDGERIAVARNSEVVIMDANQPNIPGDGIPSGVVVAYASGRASALAWSSDGERLAYRSLPADAESGVFVVSTTSDMPWQIASGGYGYLSWSPDGRYVAFDRDGEIVLAAADGSGETKLANDRSNDLRPASSPAWSPDGRSIAVTSHRDGVGAIYLVAPDGSSVTPLIQTAVQPDYLPVERTVAEPSRLSEFGLWLSQSACEDQGDAAVLPIPRRRLVVRHS